MRGVGEKTALKVRARFVSFLDYFSSHTNCRNGLVWGVQPFAPLPYGAPRLSSTDSPSEKTRACVIIMLITFAIRPLP